MRAVPRRKVSFNSVAVTAMLASALTGCATVPVTGRRQVAFVSEQQLVVQSEAVYEDILSRSRIERDTDRARMLRTVGERIARASERFMREHGMAGELGHYDWQFNLIVDDENVNAFCLPGGRVGVYTGIFKVAPDEASLAVVLGHEAAHMIAKHGNERMSQQLLVQLGHITLAAALHERPEETRELWSRVYGMGSTLGVLLPYSRRQEQEADHIGLIITAMAGYDPRAALDLWQRMRQMHGHRPLQFLSTHPAPDARIAYIRSVIPEAMRYYENAP